MSKRDFTGLGVILWDGSHNLPVFPMRIDPDLKSSMDSARYLAEISSPDNNLHDGFHILNLDMRIVSLAQYFSPPIPAAIFPNRERKFGGRYLAALFGSSLPGVVLTGISTPTLGIAVFKNGVEIYFQGA
jgi:DNA integrity scanning protein DisA with diadenylate cyclase activity